METPTEKQIQDTSNAAAMYAMEVKRIREQLTDLIEAHAKLKKHAEEVERIVREECARVCEAEYVDAEATGTAEDKAYNCAIEHCAAAIREGE